MKCNLIVGLNEVTIRDYTLIEDEGLQTLVSTRGNIRLTYEDDEERPNYYVITISAPDQSTLFSFLSFIELPVKIIT